MKVVITFIHPHIRSYCSEVLKAVTSGLERANYEADIINLGKDGLNRVLAALDLKAFRDNSSVDPKANENIARLKQESVEKRKMWIVRIAKTFAKEALA